jgi:methanogenic corrinoid protein MtbC1
MTFMEQVANSSGWPSETRQTGASSDETMQLYQQEDKGAEFLSRNRRSNLLNRVVEAEILPRLALARVGTALPHVDTPLAFVTTEADTTELVRLLMGRDNESAWTFVEMLELRGATPTSLYLGILTQAARRLGELWEDDRCDFAQVTISLGRLQQVVRSLAPSFQMAAVSRSAHADTVLLLPAPGEQHTFGLVILAEFFQREGWHITGGPASTSRDATDLVRTGWVDIAGFSAGSIKNLDSLTACIHAVRKASRNRYLGVMVGGPLFLQRPDLVARVGADTTATDAPSAICQAKGLLAMRSAAD